MLIVVKPCASHFDQFSFYICTSYRTHTPSALRAEGVLYMLILTRSVKNYYAAYKVYQVKNIVEEYIAKTYEKKMTKTEPSSFCSTPCTVRYNLNTYKNSFRRDRRKPFWRHITLLRSSRRPTYRELHNREDLLP